MFYLNGVLVKGCGVTKEEARNYVDYGWWFLIDKLYENLEKDSLAGCVEQIKEKFAGLTVYLRPFELNIDSKLIKKWDDYSRDLLLESHSICEKCGYPGYSVNDNGWIKTLCIMCYYFGGRYV
jgi:hypothetical protein